MLLASLLLAAASAALATGRPYAAGASRGAGAGPSTDPVTTSRRSVAGAALIATAVAAASAVGWAVGWAGDWAGGPVPSSGGLRTGSVPAVLSQFSAAQMAAAAVLVASGLVVVRQVGAARRTRVAVRRRLAVVDFCEALVGELRAGQPVLVALERSAETWPEVTSVVAAARVDADLPAAFRRLAASPGAESLVHLAAAWQLCAATGGGLAEAAAQVLDSARAEAAALRQVEGEVSSARATARLVAALPVVVLGAGQGLGAHPWAFLLGHPVGVTCLAAGLLLVLTGLAWIDRIAVSATTGED